MNGKFHILVFTGELHRTREKLAAFRQHVDKHAPRFAHAVRFVTIVLGSGVVFEERIGVEQFGNAYWDVDHRAHITYKIGYESGAIIVLRPDGILGFVSDIEGYERVQQYLERIIIAAEPEKELNGNTVHGDYIAPNEENLYGRPTQEGVEGVAVETGIVSR